MEYAQLKLSLQAVTETVRSHSFYVKKVVDSQTVLSLLMIYYPLSVTDKKQGAEVSQATLALCEAMAEKKEKKLQLFCDEESVIFFKNVVKRLLNGDKCLQ